MQSDLKPDRIIVKDDSGTGASFPYLQPLQSEYPLIILDTTVRDGVARSWNILMEAAGSDYTIISNDDVEVHSNTFRAIIDAAESQKNNVFFAGSGHSGNAFSLFLVRYAFWSEHRFDEYYWPAYFEDNDYAETMARLGHKIITVNTAAYAHVGSSTIARYSGPEMVEHHKQFQKNRAYFAHKWGGLPGEPGLYEIPFNGRPH